MGWNNTFPHPWGALNVSYVVEDVQHVEGVTKKTQTTWREIAQIKLNAQTVRKTTLLSQDLITYTKEKKKYLRWSINKMWIFEGEKSNYISVAWRVNPIRGINQLLQISCWETNPTGTEWLVKVSGAIEKPTLSQNSSNRKRN